jgi:uncharacterized protein DUF3237
LTVRYFRAQCIVNKEIREAIMKLVAGALPVALLFAAAGPAAAEGPTTSLKTEYLMTLNAPLDAPQAIDQSLLVFNVQAGVSVEGPKIKGKIVAPAADWGRIMPSGVFRLDVRLTIRTDDNQLIFMTYGGAIQFTSKEQGTAWAKERPSRRTTSTLSLRRRSRRMLRNTHGSMLSRR